MAAGVYELGQTDEFRSEARIKLEAPDRSRFTEMVAEPKDPDAEFFQVETEAILSDSILSNVVYRLELREKWGKKYFNSEPELRMERNHRVLETGKIKTAEAVRLMRERLEVIRVPNTTMADIVFVSDDPDEAANIANMVAEVYKDWRNGTRQRIAQGGIEALKKHLEIQDGKIKTSQDELDRLRTKLKIPDAEVASESSRTNFPTYWDEKMNLERLNDVRQLIIRKMNISEKVMNNLPSYNLAEIIEHAVPAKTPVRYHRRSGAMFVCLGFVLLGCSAVVLRKSNRAHP